MKRRDFIAGLGATTVWPLAAHAQQPANLPTIGFLGTTTPSVWREYVPAFVQRLRELVWVEGKTVATNIVGRKDATNASGPRG